MDTGSKIIIFAIETTLIYLEKETGTQRKELLDWSVAEFKYNLVYLAWYNKAVKSYQDIQNKRMDTKAKRKK